MVNGVGSKMECAIGARIPKFTATDRDLVRPWLRTLNWAADLTRTTGHPLLYNAQTFAEVA